MQRPKKLPLMTFLVIMTIGIGYVQQVAPSPILSVLSEYYHLAGQDALLNLSVSITFPMSIVACLAGGILESRLGIRRLYLGTQIFLTAGVLLNFWSPTYLMFLAARSIYSIGFGLAIPFIGSAIMNWYTGRARDTMNTLNGMFPFIGTVISIALMLPLSNLLGSWKVAMGIWGVVLLVLLAVWLVCIRAADIPQSAAVELPERGIYRSLWRRKNIKLLCLVFVMDFFCYSYMVVVLPTLIAEGGGMDPRCGQPVRRPGLPPHQSGGQHPGRRGDVQNRSKKAHSHCGSDSQICGRDRPHFHGELQRTPGPGGHRHLRHRKRHMDACALHHVHGAQGHDPQPLRRGLCSL